LALLRGSSYLYFTKSRSGMQRAPRVEGRHHTRPPATRQFRGRAACAREGRTRARLNL